MSDERVDTFHTPKGDEEDQDPPAGNELLPLWAAKFLNLLTMNGSVSMSARLVGYSRSTIYKLAARSPVFRQALNEAKLEFRDLLLGEAHRRAIREGSDNLLRKLLDLYFPQAINPQTGVARVDPTKITDEEIGQVATLEDDVDLEALSIDELEVLDRLLGRAYGTPPRSH